MTDTNTTKPIPILIDCDPGADDFFALIRALIMHKRGFVDIVAITTSGGNVPAQVTYENAIRACMMLGVNNIPIGKGTDKLGVENASHIHGNDGIGGLSTLLPPIPTVTAHDSENILLETIHRYGKSLEILAVGPLTNLAKVEIEHPGTLVQVKRIISMGGAFFVPGNVTPVAEFNIWYDPESADIVYNSGVHIAAIPLDITTQFVFTMNDLRPILRHVNNAIHQAFLTRLTEFTIGTNMDFRETHYRRGFFVHDANTVGFLLYPHLYKGTFYQVYVETQGEYTKGQTIVDKRNHPKTSTNAFVVTEIDSKGFLEAMTQDFESFDFSVQ